MTDGVEWKIDKHSVAHDEAVRTMESRVASIRDGATSELVWLLEHPPIYTAGTSAHAEDLVAPGDIPVVPTGRGGAYTYHGPGQRVAYVLLDLSHRGRDVRRHVDRLQDWLIRTLARFGVSAEIRSGRVGVWVVRRDGREEKIGSIGVRLRHWVSYHGASLNVNPDLSAYGGIIPCGIRDHGVTSLHELGIIASMDEVDAALKDCFSESFEN